MRSPKSVVDELEYLQKTFGAHQFTFYDDAFTVDQERAAEICREIKNRKLRVEWDCETRVDMVTEELLRTMKEAGCFVLCCGLWSMACLRLRRIPVEARTRVQQRMDELA